METIQFEGMKTGLKQSKDGYMLSLAVHPDDLPDNLIRDFVGARYMVVMVRIGDDEQPVKQVRKSDPVVSMAGMVCRDSEFWMYVCIRDDEMIGSEAECAEWMKMYFDIESRADFKTNDVAREKFIKFKEDFEQWKK
jgi:hypothetical protein